MQFHTIRKMLPSVLMVNLYVKTNAFRM